LSKPFLAVLAVLKKEGFVRGNDLKTGNILGVDFFMTGWVVNPFMVRQGSPERSRRAHHERLNLKLSCSKLVADKRGNQL
jgi:hypothetical protein